MPSPAGAVDSGDTSARETELQRKIEQKKIEIAAAENDKKDLEKLLHDEAENRKKRKYEEYMTKPSDSEDEGKYLPSRVDAAIAKSKAAIRTLENNLQLYNSIKSEMDDLVTMASTPIPADMLTDLELSVLEKLNDWLDVDRISTSNMKASIPFGIAWKLESIRAKFALQRHCEPPRRVKSPRPK